KVFLPLADQLEPGVQVLEQVVGLDHQVARLDHLAANLFEAALGFALGFARHRNLPRTGNALFNVVGGSHGDPNNTANRSWHFLTRRRAAGEARVKAAAKDFPERPRWSGRSRTCSRRR